LQLSSALFELKVACQDMFLSVSLNRCIFALLKSLDVYVVGAVCFF
jgi:hypothetical protein